jgi:uncharacterized OB-fold protein
MSAGDSRTVTARRKRLIAAGRRRESPEQRVAVVPSTRPRTGPPPPFLLDFYPLESSEQTRLHPFYTALKEGRLTTTRCRKTGTLLWPPRVICPKCHDDALDWVDLPHSGRIYAFSAVLAGAPLGMEEDVPFTVGLVDLEGVPIRIFGRIVGASWSECRIGEPVRVEGYLLEDGRVFYRFRVAARHSTAEDSNPRV